MQIYRNFEIGKLIKLIMLDTRIIGRSPQNASLAAVNVRAPGMFPCYAIPICSALLCMHDWRTGTYIATHCSCCTAAGTGMHV